MPKIVDHEQRRHELAAAVWRVISRAGIVGATVRAVASEAGWSMGTLRYYFESQDDLLRFAVEIGRERIPGRLKSHIESGVTGRQLAQRLLEELLPLDAERRVEAAVWLALVERARTDAGFDDIRRRSWEGERRICRRAIIETTGSAPPADYSRALRPADLERAAEVLHTYIDGLTIQATAFPEHNRPSRVKRSLATYLAALAE